METEVTAILKKIESALLLKLIGGITCKLRPRSF